ncbi:MAG: site-specific DNA-methyltransferase [Prevotella sp.]|nr:site-specific DNA-methyltransferase [Prevotella sp.]
MADFREQYNAFIETLQSIFMMDHEELDFGIYRIMNYKRDEINDFLKNKLLVQVDNILAANVGSDQLQKEKELGDRIAVLSNQGLTPDIIDTLPPIIQLREELKQFRSIADLKGDVFSALVTFFSRYYNGGDFISQRRYKSSDTYAIPYNGEEVRLYWANEDQYYIKTSEYFKDYSFKIPGGKMVHFVLKDANTEQNNNQTERGKIRCFDLFKDQSLPTVEVKDEELKIFFTFNLFPKAKDLQQKLNVKTIEALSSLIPSNFSSLFSAISPTNGRSFLEKNLTDYTAKNTFDYFIHKNLGKFLSRELDFFLKSEVINIDNLDAQKIRAHIATAKTVKEIGQKIISMLAQVENFQKRLWLKKKFIIQSDFCITLDLIPEEFYEEIASNEKQRNEWIRLYHIEEIQPDTPTQSTPSLFDGEDYSSDEAIVGYSTPLTMEFLKQNKHLVLDTAFFDVNFKHKLLAQMNDIDAQCQGLLVNSENFQALRLLLERFKHSVKSIYVDPPYNTSASVIAYKNNYKHSSWLSLMEDRLRLGKEFLTEDGIQCTTIDDVEQSKLNLLLENVFDAQPQVVAIRIKPSGRPIPNGFAIAHEYGLFSKATDKVAIQRLSRSDDQLARYREQDEHGPFFWEMLRKAGSNSRREDRPTMYYPIYWNRETDKFRLPDMEYDENCKEFEIKEQPAENEVAVYPIRDDGSDGRWYFGLENIVNHINYLKAETQSNGIVFLYYRRRPNEGVQPLTTWGDSKYSATEHGTDLLKKMDIPFDYPKSIYAVEDCLRVSGCDSEAVVLDYFGGSGTTCHAVMNLNREDEERGHRKYILCDMAGYFDSALRTRAERAIYSPDWFNGKPLSRNKGFSQCFKYIRLEQYEDTLNNLEVKKPIEDLLTVTNDEFAEDYMLHYMLQTETNDSLLNDDYFIHPFDVKLSITHKNEQKPTDVDMVETFNYLIGLHVVRMKWPNDNVCIVFGRQHGCDKPTVVIWRDMDATDNEALKSLFNEHVLPVIGNKAYTIYVNGENTLQNLAGGNDRWTVKRTEKEFIHKMFEE